MTQRTQTPVINRIWGSQAQLRRWMEIWIQHLQLQVEHNPKHPGSADLEHYKATRDGLTSATDAIVWLTWLQAWIEEETKTRHDLVAALNVFNRKADRDTLHLGLTSADVTETAQQIAILDSIDYLVDLIGEVVDKLGHAAIEQGRIRTVGRTHGQPAQLTTLGYRQGNILQSLMLWMERLDAAVASYRMRFPGGAVGTGADLLRVLEGWGRGPEEGAYPAEEEVPVELQRYADQLAVRLGFSGVCTVGRQTGERVQDLHLAGLMVELSLIARQWATDRRLEGILGHGREAQKTPDQVGSSAMPHKHNPILCERMVALASLTPGYYAQVATMASNEFLEGDVSTSAARRKVWPQLFQTIAEMLANWSDAIDAWEADPLSIAVDLRHHRDEVTTGAWMQLLIERGKTRTQAHEILRANRTVREISAASGVDLADLRRVRLEVAEGPIGRALSRQDLADAARED